MRAGLAAFGFSLDEGGEIWKASGFGTAAITLFATRAVPEIVTSFGVFLSALALGVVPREIVFSGFSSGGDVKGSRLAMGRRADQPRRITKRDPLKYFKTSPEIIRLAVMLYVRFPLLLRNVEDLLHERGIKMSHEAVRFWWHRIGPHFASELRKRRIVGVKSIGWRWHLDEIFVKINGERHYLWRSVDHEGEVFESFVTKTRGKKAELKFIRKKCESKVVPK